MSGSRTSHLDEETLLDYWLGDADAARTEAIDRHLLQCDACGAQLDQLIALSRGVREAFDRGEVGTVVTPAFVEQLKAAGRRVREYRAEPGSHTACGIAPDDEALVTRAVAPLGGVTRVDALVAFSHAPGDAQRLVDVPFDAASGEVVFVVKLAEVRTLPSHDFVLRLVAVDERAGERELGRYDFHHSA